MDKISYSLAAKAIKGLLTKANIKGSSVLLPRGDTLSRPVLDAAEVAIRYNTDTQDTEIWNGLVWDDLKADITAINLKGTDTEANILSIADADNGDLWIASDTLDAWAHDGINWINIGPLQGPQGDKGDQGNSITSVIRTSGNGAQGTVDTYTITFSDLTTTTFQITNGSNGTSIDHVAKVSGSGAPGTTDIYEAWLDAEETNSVGTFTVYNGMSVDHVSKTSGTGAAGTTDTYTAWGDAAETQALGTFVLYNGADGTGAINDTTITTTTLWSSSKINSEILAMSIALG